MIKNPFAQAAQGEANLKRNAYDLSFQNLFSTHFGRLTPAMMQEVLPGDSFEIDSSLAIQGMPTVFPLQTRVRVSVEYYYCRNRCVMDDFEDFIFKTKDVEQCWLKMNEERAQKMISTGSLGDFFGLPTTYASDTPLFTNVSTNNPAYFIGRISVQEPSDTFLTQQVASLISAGNPISTPNNPSYYNSTVIGYFTDSLETPLVEESFVSLGFTSTINSFVTQDTHAFLIFTSSTGVPFSLPIKVKFDSWNENSKTFVKVTSIDSNYSLVDISKVFLSQHSSYKIFLCSNTTGTKVGNDYPLTTTLYFNTTPTSSVAFPSKYSFKFAYAGIMDATDSAIIDSNPFVGNTPALKVNALPYRHYTQVCNYYHRNDKNNPYILNGEAQYNEFIPTHATGADENLYEFCYRNWELDRFTSAVQSPQFGEAPLVGLTFSGADTAKLTFQDADDPNQTYTATLGIDDDRITDIADFSKDIPSANLRKLQEMISYGISINDLRVTNSFQRFLENVLRRGLRYRSQLKSHFGVSVDYPDIDIPQYIGGYSGELTVGKVTSTAETSEAGLGDFNGSLSGQISSQHKIRCYCPEHGYIMCLVSLTPIPVYGQVCSKNMIKTDPFDYFLPEFGKIGFVPMHYSEVMPLQTAAGENVNDVFGYQKAWYDYMMNYDQVHSYFRTNMKDFVLQRTFAQRPELVKDFTVINPEQLSDVFVTGNISDKYDVNDKFLCNFYTHMISKRCIPRVGTPSLE